MSQSFKNSESSAFDKKFSEVAICPKRRLSPNSCLSKMTFTELSDISPLFTRFSPIRLSVAIALPYIKLPL